MIKKVFGILFVLAAFAACTNQGQKSEETKEKEIAAVTVDEVNANIQSYVDKEIVIKGTVNHVCSHGGKRMFIMGTDPDVAIKITPNDEIGVFEKELEGSHVKVTGIMKELRIDEAYVANLEKEEAESEALHDHSGGTHEETTEEAEQKQHQIDAMREQIAASENGYYSQFWIEASKFEVVEGDQDHEDIKSEAHDHEHEHAESEEHSN